MPLNTGNITDDKTEALLALARTLAAFKLYGDEMPYDDHHGEDAMVTLNGMITQARELIS